MPVEIKRTVLGISHSEGELGINEVHLNSRVLLGVVGGNLEHRQLALVEGQLLDGLYIELHFLSNLDKLNQLSSRTDLWRRKSAWSVVDPREKQERR